MIDLLHLLVEDNSRRGLGRYGSFSSFSGSHLQSDLYLALSVANLCVAGLMLYQRPNLDYDVFQATVFISCSALAGFLWKKIWRSYHYISDTATSRVETAAQGLVELHGTGDLLAGKLSQGIAMGPPSLWQSYSIHSGNQIQESGVSTAPFLLRDKSGTCVVYPEGATVISSSRATPRQGELYASIHYLRPGADIYVLGEFKTVGGDHDTHDLSHETTEILRQWKSDQRRLVADYDTDGDGRIDAAEWEVARSHAGEQAEQKIRQKRYASHITHEIRKPTNGLPLIISDKDPVHLEKRFYSLGLSNLALSVSCFVVGAMKLS